MLIVISDFGCTLISDFGFEISDLPADSPAFKSEIVHPRPTERKQSICYYRCYQSFGRAKSEIE